MGSTMIFGPAHLSGERTSHTSRPACSGSLRGTFWTMQPEAAHPGSGPSLPAGSSSARVCTRLPGMTTQAVLPERCGHPHPTPPSPSQQLKLLSHTLPGLTAEPPITTQDLLKGLARLRHHSWSRAGTFHLFLLSHLFVCRGSGQATQTPERGLGIVSSFPGGSVGS